jgi:hypothetical protein
MHYKSTNPFIKGTRMWYLYRLVKRNIYSIMMIVIMILFIVGVHSLLAPEPPILEPDNGTYVAATIVEPTMVDADPPAPIHIAPPDIEPPAHVVHATSPYTDSPYTEADVILLASILQAECWEGDWHKEATVIVNILEHRAHEFYNPDGTLQGVIEARNGRAFNGSLTDGYKNRLYTDYAYTVAYDVLIDGYRSWDGDPTMLYFSNLDTATDTGFIDSINWVEVQPNSRSHSFGKDY